MAQQESVLRTIEFGTSEPSKPRAPSKPRELTAAEQLTEFFTKKRASERGIKTALEKLRTRVSGRYNRAQQRVFDLALAERLKRQIELTEKSVREAGGNTPEAIAAAKEELKDDKQFVNELINDLLAGDPIGKQMLVKAKIGINLFSDEPQTGAGINSLRAIARQTTLAGAEQFVDALRLPPNDAQKQLGEMLKEMRATRGPESQEAAAAVLKFINDNQKQLKLPKSLIASLKKSLKGLQIRKRNEQRNADFLEAIDAFEPYVNDRPVPKQAQVVIEKVVRKLAKAKSAGEVKDILIATGEALLAAAAYKLTGKAFGKLGELANAGIKRLAAYMSKALPDPEKMMAWVLDKVKAAGDQLLQFFRTGSAAAFDVITGKRPPSDGEPPSGGAPQASLGVIQRIANALTNTLTVAQRRKLEAQPAEQFAAESASIQAAGPTATEVLDANAIARRADEQEAARQAALAEQQQAAALVNAAKQAQPAETIQQVPTAGAPAGTPQDITDGPTFIQRIKQAGLTGLAAATVASVGYQANRAYQRVRRNRANAQADIDSGIFDTERPIEDLEDLEAAPPPPDEPPPPTISDRVAHLGGLVAQRARRTFGKEPAPPSLPDPVGFPVTEREAREVRDAAPSRFFAPDEPPSPIIFDFKRLERRVLARGELNAISRRIADNDDFEGSEVARRFDALGVPPSIAASEDERNLDAATTEQLLSEDAPTQGGTGLETLWHVTHHIAQHPEERAKIAAMVQAMSNAGVTNPTLQAMNLAPMIASGKGLDTSPEHLPAVVDLISAQAPHHWPRDLSPEFREAVAENRERRMADVKRQLQEGLAVFNGLQDELHEELYPELVAPSAARTTERGDTALNLLMRQVMLGGSGSNAQSMGVLAARAMHSRGQISRDDLDQFTTWIMSQ